MRIVFDIDGTLWESVYYRAENKYGIERYDMEMIKRVNKLYSEGHVIILQTARHWDKYIHTKEQLKAGGILYHELVMGNIPADYYVNDKGLTPNGFIKAFEQILVKEKEHGK